MRIVPLSLLLLACTTGVEAPTGLDALAIDEAAPPIIIEVGAVLPGSLFQAAVRGLPNGSSIGVAASTTLDLVSCDVMLFGLCMDVGAPARTATSVSQQGTAAISFGSPRATIRIPDRAG